MRKTYIHILAGVVAALTLASCDKEDAEPAVTRNYPTFSASIDGSYSRAADNYWENGDNIGISDGELINVCYVCNVTLAGDTLALVNPEQQFIFKNANDVTFTAYYPYSPDMPDSQALAVSTADQTNQQAFDFLWASGTGSRTSPTVDFTFTHRMSRVTFVFKNGRNMDVSTINKIRLNGLVMDGTFDTTTGICGVSEETPTAPVTVELTDVRAEVPLNPLLIIPQKAETVKLEIYDSDSQYYACNLALPDNELLAGTTYTYTITVSKTGLKVTAASLSDWFITNGQDSEASSADE